MAHKRSPHPTGSAAGPAAPTAKPAGERARTVSEVPLAPGENTSGQRKYKYAGGFDFDKIASGMAVKFKHNDHYDERSLPNMQVLLGMIEADALITDIRWMAYMLATAMWETSHVESFQVPRTGKDGKVMTGKDGKVITRARKVWINMKPVHETGEGAGRRYHNPVKVAAQPTGELKITEWNGNVFTLKTNGEYTSAVHGRVPGTNPPARPVEAYNKAAGDEHSYFGRGYVQLTWWYNYASAGVLLDKGLTLVTDPENAMIAQTAYDLMSLCMRTGKGFANKHKFDDYFSGIQRDYEGARAMVNAADVDSIAKVANIARLFEDVLWDARKSTT